MTDFHHSSSLFPRVRVITVELTYRCHRRCAFCFAPRDEAHQASQVELPLDQLAELIGELLRDTGCRRVQLSGGEPLLRQDVLQFIDALEGAQISLITDGAHLDEELARALLHRGVAPIQPTLLAGRADVHDSLRGAGSFAETTRAIATAASIGLPVVVSMVVTSRNWAEAAAVAELSFALGARTFALARFCAPAGGHGAQETQVAKALAPTARQVEQAAQEAAATCRQVGLRLASVITIPRCTFRSETTPLATGVCSLVGPTTTVTISPDGSVRSCGLSRHSVGRLGESTWKTLNRRLWEKELAPLRSHVPAICQGCAHLESCRGGCRLSGAAWGDDADPLALGPAHIEDHDQIQAHDRNRG